MKSLRVYLIVVLALALITVSSFAWRWHVELAGLASMNMSKNPKDMSAIEKRVWDAEQRARKLEADLAKAKLDLEAALAQQGQGGRGRATDPNAVAGGRGQNAQNAFGGRGANPQQALQQIMNRPEFQQAQAIQQKAQVEMQYAGLVRNLGLSGEQGDKVKSLILDRDIAMQDATAAAQAAGLNPRTPEYQQFLDQAMATANDNLKGTLGENGYTALTNYDATQTQRNVVNTFQQQLLQYGTANLLSDAQSEQLTQILANSRGAQRGGATGADQITAFARAGGGGGGGAVAQAFIGAAGGAAITAMMGGGQQISPNALSQAQSILSPVQYQALQTMQQSQQAQQQIMTLTTGALAQQQQQQQQQQQRTQQGTQPATGTQTTRGAAQQTRGGGGAATGGGGRRNGG